ncbi:hypothetical protein SprV_0802561000 [Sparganum proliferum]
MSSAARQLKEKCQETRINLSATFVDLMNTTDEVNSEGVWRIMQKFGCPKRFTQMMCQPHDDMMAQVTENGTVYRRKLFQSRISTSTVQELLFGDDFVLNITSPGDIRKSINLPTNACYNFGLVINTERPVVMHQPPPDAALFALQTCVNDAKLKIVDNFTYLGRALSRRTEIVDKISRHVSKASIAFDHLNNTVWNRHGLQRSTKLMVYKAVILPMVLQPAAPTNINLRTANISDEDLVHTCPYCDCTFISHIDLVSHLH